MKTINLKSLGILVIALSLTTTVFSATQKVDATKSTVNWNAKKVTGEHHGTIAIKEGNLEVSNGKVTGGKVVIDMQSIADLDLTDPAWNAKLVGHLKTDDFFSVATYPTSELLITKVDGTGSSRTFTGNLTIKGITNPATFTATSSKEGNVTTYKGTMTVDRSKFNIRYGSKSFFDN